MKKYTTEEFIKKSKEKHGDKYDYSLVEYVNKHTKVKIICKEHGVFEQGPSSHLQGYNCLFCGQNKRNKTKTKTTQQFITESTKIHKNKYDYSLVEYKKCDKNIIIICKEHGIFEQTPSTHLFGYGCSKCSKSHNHTTEEYIKLSNKIHNNKYDYTITEYVNKRTKIKIICKEHGEFNILPGNHIYGRQSGCSKCSILNKKKTRSEQFITNSIKTHKKIYNYSLVKYINAYTKIKIICLTHGIFEQKPNNHTNLKQGCPFCKKSNGEQMISKILLENNIIFETQKTFEYCKNKRKLPFDFYLTDYNICIEYDGIQHFESVEYFGGEKRLLHTQINDKIKNEYCYENNIHLIRIKYNENIYDSILRELTPFLSFSTEIKIS